MAKATISANWLNDLPSQSRDYYKPSANQRHDYGDENCTLNERQNATRAGNATEREEKTTAKRRRPIRSGTTKNEKIEIATVAEQTASTMNETSSKGSNRLACTVHFLDGTVREFHVEKNSMGDELLRQVFDYLELIERDFFSLQFISLLNSSTARMRWLDAKKSLKRQIVCAPFQLFFRVKFYVNEPENVRDPLARHLLYLQIRKDFLDGKFYNANDNFELIFLLASFAAQSEYGDAPADEDYASVGDYLRDFKFLPVHPNNFSTSVARLHCAQRGLTRADAQFNFCLYAAKRISLYGFDLYNAKDGNGRPILIGVNFEGISVLDDTIIVNRFVWTVILKLSFKRKMFYLRIRQSSGVEQNSSNNNSTEWEELELSFNAICIRNCKMLWKSCTEHHEFFRVSLQQHTPQQQPTCPQYLHNSHMATIINSTGFMTRLLQFRGKKAHRLPYGGQSNELSSENHKKAPHHRQAHEPEKHCSFADELIVNDAYDNRSTTRSVSEHDTVCDTTISCISDLNYSNHDFDEKNNNNEDKRDYNDYNLLDDLTSTLAPPTCDTLTVTYRNEFNDDCSNYNAKQNVDNMLNTVDHNSSVYSYPHNRVAESEWKSYFLCDPSSGQEEYGSTRDATIIYDSNRDDYCGFATTLLNSTSSTSGISMALDESRSTPITTIVHFNQHQIPSPAPLPSYTATTAPTFDFDYRMTSLIVSDENSSSNSEAIGSNLLGGEFDTMDDGPPYNNCDRLAETTITTNSTLSTTTTAQEKQQENDNEQQTTRRDSMTLCSNAKNHRIPLLLKTDTVNKCALQQQTQPHNAATTLKCRKSPAQLANLPPQPKFATKVNGQSKANVVNGCALPQRHSLVSPRSASIDRVTEATSLGYANRGSGSWPRPRPLHCPTPPVSVIDGAQQQIPLSTPNAPPNIIFVVPVSAICANNGGGSIACVNAANDYAAVRRRSNTTLSSANSCIPTISQPHSNSPQRFSNSSGSSSTSSSSARSGSVGFAGSAISGRRPSPPHILQSTTQQQQQQQQSSRQQQMAILLRIPNGTTSIPLAATTAVENANKNSGSTTPLILLNVSNGIDSNYGQNGFSRQQQSNDNNGGWNTVALPTVTVASAANSRRPSPTASTCSSQLSQCSASQADAAGFGRFAADNANNKFENNKHRKLSQTNKNLRIRTAQKLPQPPTFLQQQSKPQQQQQSQRLKSNNRVEDPYTANPTTATTTTAYNQTKTNLVNNNNIYNKKDDATEKTTNPPYSSENLLTQISLRMTAAALDAPHLHKSALNDTFRRSQQQQISYRHNSLLLPSSSSEATTTTTPTTTALQQTQQQPRQQQQNSTNNNNNNELRRNESVENSRTQQQKQQLPQSQLQYKQKDERTEFPVSAQNTPKPPTATTNSLYLKRKNSLTKSEINNNSNNNSNNNNNNNTIRSVNNDKNIASNGCTLKLAVQAQKRPAQSSANTNSALSNSERIQPVTQSLNEIIAYGRQCAAVSEEKFPQKSARTVQHKFPAKTTTNGATAAEAISARRSENLAHTIINGGNIVTVRVAPEILLQSKLVITGGADCAHPAIVSRIVSGASVALNEGDQLLQINGLEISRWSQAEVTVFLQQLCERSKEIMLTIKPNVYRCGGLIITDFEEDEKRAAKHSSALLNETLHVADTVPRSDKLAESMSILRRMLDGNSLALLFDQVYRKRSGLSMDAAHSMENASKNRYRDVCPYDSTRVKLKNASSGDYINANHVNMKIQSSGIVNRYIAAQGPLPHTTVDFWWMVWEQNSTTIVMLTTVVEKGRVKCHQYWPDAENKSCQRMDCGNLTLTAVSERVEAHCHYREISICHKVSGEKRLVTQMQYTSWPDHGVPDNPEHFIKFVDEVRAIRKGSIESVIVHCSAGIGRTGVLILMETAVCMIEANEPVYPLDIMRSMRDQRAMLIQTIEQFEFVCRSILRTFEENNVKPLAEYQRKSGKVTARE